MFLDSPLGFGSSNLSRSSNFKSLNACTLVTSQNEKCRAGSGHFFYGPGRVRAGRFWPGSGWPFLASGQFGPPILAYFCPFLTNFSAKSAIFLVRAGSGHPKSGPGRVGPLKTHGLRAKFRVRLWPDSALPYMY